MRNDPGESAWWVYGLPSEMKSVPAINSEMVYVSGYNVPENDAGQQFDVPPFEEAMAEYDADGNGRVSRDELPAGRVRKLFGFSDGNRDGELNKQEWRIYAAAQRSENGLRAIRLGGRGNTTEQSIGWKVTKGAHNYRQLEEQTSQQTIAFYQQAFAPAYSSYPKQ